MVAKNAVFAFVAPIVAVLKKKHQLPQYAAAQIVCRVFVVFPVAQHASRARQVILSARFVFMTRVILIPHLTKVDPLLQLWVAYSIFFHGVACWIQLGGMT